MDTREKTNQRAGYLFILIFILLTTVIITVSYLSYRNYQNHYRGEVERNLSSIAKLKVDELVDWRQDRLGDASIFFKNPAFTSLVQGFLENPKNADTRWRIQTWIGKFQMNFQYDQVRLLDTQGVTLLSVPANNRLPVSSAILQSLPEILRSGQVTFQDFYRNDYNQHIYLSVLVPIIDEKNHNRPLAILSLRINPEVDLYPFIQHWPTDSRTAETLLVRREGNDALFLNELRFQKNTALNLQFSLAKKEIPAVKAVLGQEGIVEGKDYRGVPTVAYVCAVPESPWFLVARIDTSEVYAPMREHLWMMVGLVIIVLLGTAAFVGFLWRQQNLRFYRERYQAAEKLMESKALVDAVVENVPLMIFLKEATDLRFVMFNRAGEELLGYDRKALLGKNNLELFPPEQAAHFMANDREVLDGEAGMLDIPEEPILTAKKGNRLLHTRKVCIRGANGKTKFLLGISEDITERKKAEEERNSLQEQLIRSEKLAAVGELIAGVVHEINNPLTGIKGFSEFLLMKNKENFDEETKKALQSIHQSSERIEKIVKNLQRFARREEPNRKNVNINELIDVIISIRNYEMEARNVKVERHYQPDLPLVMADPSQLEQIFLNLIINAKDAIHDNQQKAGTLTIVTSVVPDNAGGTVVIEFSDTGTGIPIDVLPKLFNPFFTTKGVGKGTGLGLSVSYGIIKGHGGEIFASNRAEGGAVFTIELPVLSGGGVKDD